MACSCSDLQSLTVDELRRTAQAVGIPGGQIEAAQDNLSLIQLIEARAQVVEASAVENVAGSAEFPGSTAAGSSPLQSLTIGQLHETAQAVGITGEQIEAARVSLSPKETLIQLIETRAQVSAVGNVAGSSASDVAGSQYRIGEAATSMLPGDDATGDTASWYSIAGGGL
jgi:hypothetical protein